MQIIFELGPFVILLLAEIAARVLVGFGSMKGFGDGGGGGGFMVDY